MEKELFNFPVQARVLDREQRAVWLPPILFGGQDTCAYSSDMFLSS